MSSISLLNDSSDQRDKRIQEILNKKLLEISKEEKANRDRLKDHTQNIAKKLKDIASTGFQ